MAYDERRDAGARGFDASPRPQEQQSHDGPGAGAGHRRHRPPARPVRPPQAEEAGRAPQVHSDLEVLTGERERSKEVVYLTTHSTHFIYGYMNSDIW